MDLPYIATARKLAKHWLTANALNIKTLGAYSDGRPDFLDDLAQFAEFVARNEREECAKICDFCDPTAAAEIRSRT